VIACVNLVSCRAHGRRRCRRQALTLLEVLIALAIFLLAMVVFGEMIVQNGETATYIQRLNLANRLCKSKMAEVASGLVPLSSQDEVAFDDAPDFTWSLDAESGAVDGLWTVTVTVRRPPTDNAAPIEVSLTQMVRDPSIAGNTEDVTPVITSASNSSNTGSSSSNAAAAPANNAAAAPAPAVAPAPAPAATPKATTPSTPTRGT
jgi:prepilin-type N-terminal cleavage/methylation domain-containing protein